ncbi:hypothetical protein [Leifsonia sp. LS1]|uniref:hypothetical protein n=1 Tax=Leifsonia sp. LS1 TaxID=2828483 RepID=UPI001CFCAD93|nr:hypothetical protein [Leifsonia sp. LS1]
MTDTSSSSPEDFLQAFIVEGDLIPVRELEYDIRSLARIAALSAWLGTVAFGEQAGQLLDAEAIDELPVRRIQYGSPLTIDFQMLPWVLSYAVAATPTVVALLKRIGQLRVDFANASESNARRDATQEDAETTRSVRKLREYRERLHLIRDAAESLRPSLDENDALMVDHLVRQAELRPDLLQDSIDALWQLSEKTVRVQSVSAGPGGDSAAEA